MTSLTPSSLLPQIFQTVHTGLDIHWVSYLVIWPFHLVMWWSVLSDGHLSLILSNQPFASLLVLSYTFSNLYGLLVSPQSKNSVLQVGAYDTPDCLIAQALKKTLSQTPPAKEYVLKVRSQEDYLLKNYPLCQYKVKPVFHQVFGLYIYVDTSISVCWKVRYIQKRKREQKYTFISNFIA